MHTQKHPHAAPHAFVTCAAATVLACAWLGGCSADTKEAESDKPSLTADSGGPTTTSVVTNTVAGPSTTVNGTTQSVTTAATTSAISAASSSTSGSSSGMSTTGQSGTGVTGAGGMTMTSSVDTDDSGAGGSTTGGKPPAVRSAGCAKANPPTGSSQSPLNVANHQYYVKLPANYDPDTAYPVIFMFHPTGNPLNWAEQNAGFEKNGAKDAAIRVYPGAANNGNGWGSNDVDFFEPLYSTIIDNFCVDEARMFAAGESSGGDFVSILGCEFADKLRAVAPCATKNVNGYPLNAETRPCTGQVTAVVIHGKMDNVVGPENGPLTRDFYAELNHCGTLTQPVDGYTDPMSNCIQYTECDADYPVYWCQHTDPEYSGTNHGWPHFAGDMLWELFSSY